MTKKSQLVPVTYELRQPVHAAVAPIAALLLAVAILHMGNGLQNTLIPVRAGLESFSSTQIAAMGSAYFFGFLLGAYYGARLVRSVGHIRTFTAMVAIASAVVLCHALWITAASWFVMRAVSGFCFAVLYMVIESWLNEKSTSSNRGFVFALYAVANFGMIGVGQLLLTVGSLQTATLFLVSSIIISVAAVPVALTKAVPPAPIESVRIRVKELYRISPVGALGCFAVGVSGGAFWSLAPVFCQSVTGNTTIVALFMSLTIFAGAVGQWPLGFISDRIDRRYVISVAAIGVGMASLGLAIGRPVDGRTLLILGAIYGFFAFPLYTLCVAHVNDFVGGEKFVEASGGLLFVWGVGAILGPLLGAGATLLVGNSGVFYATALSSLLLAGYAAYRLTQRPSPPVEDRGAFADAVRASQTVAPIDVIEHSESGGQ